MGNPSGGGTAPTDPAGHLGHTIYRSTDGGKTYSQGIDDPNGEGYIIFDPKSTVLYELPGCLKDPVSRRRVAVHRLAA